MGSEMCIRDRIKNMLQIRPAIDYIDRRILEIPGVAKDTERLIGWKNKLAILRTKLQAKLQAKPSKRGRSGAESYSNASDDDDVASVESGAVQIPETRSTATCSPTRSTSSTSPIPGMRALRSRQSRASASA